VEPGPPDAHDAFARDFAAALEVAVQLDETNPNRLRLVLNENVRLPYFNALRVIWLWREGVKESEVLYNWRSRPQPALAEKDYDPVEEPRLATVKLLFYPTAEARNQLGVPDEIEKTLLVLRTSAGLTVPPAQGSSTIARLTAPADGARINDTFTIGLTVTPPAKAPAEDSVIHVLLRPIDGSSVWQNRYIILPRRLRVSDVAQARPEQRHHAVKVSLRGLLGSPSPDEASPTRFEIVVVELPFPLRGWYLPRELLDLSKPSLKPLVKDIRRVELQSGIALSRLSGAH
jgi:hypothetical protein